MPNLPDILTETQRRFLTLLGQSELVAGAFYLSGGTALFGFFIPYRYSEDLDFFSADEIDLSSLSTFIKNKQKELGVTSVEYQQSFNRNLYFLTMGDEILKAEFTYYPFPRIETGKKKFGVQIDSLLDIAVNKLFTIYQQSRARDYMDLYMICRETHWTISDLILKAKAKFDWHLDALQLGTQFMKAQEAKDYPRLMLPLDDTQWQEFFKSEAKRLKPKILE